MIIFIRTIQVKINYSLQFQFTHSLILFFCVRESKSTNYIYIIYDSSTILISSSVKPYNAYTIASISFSRVVVSASGLYYFKDNIWSAFSMNSCCSIKVIFFIGSLARFIFFISANASPFSGFSK